MIILITVGVFLVNLVSGPTSVTASGLGITKQSLFEAHNEQRERFNLGQLEVNESLSISAQRKAEAMLDADCWAHYCPQGKSPWDFFDEAGYEYLVAGENLAEGFNNTAAVMNAWMNSPTHRENILRSDYKEIGFGIVTGEFQGKRDNVIVVVHFGTPAPNRSPIFIGSNSLPQPTILKPENRSFTKNKSVEIRGIAPEAKSVEIITNDEESVEIPATEGIFTYTSNYENGKYNIRAVSKNGFLRSGPSQNHTFTVDTEFNVIEKDNFTLLELQDEVLKFSITSKDLESMSVFFGKERIILSSKDGNNWVGNVATKLLDDISEITVENLDKANNAWDGKLASDFIKEGIVKLASDAEEQHEARILSLKQSINISVLVVLIGLYVIDFLILNRTGLTKFTAKRQLHLALLVIVLIVSTAGAFGGEILQGVSANLL